MCAERGQITYRLSWLGGGIACGQLEGEMMGRFVMFRKKLVSIAIYQYWNDYCEY